LSLSGKQGFDCGEITLRIFFRAIGLEGTLLPHAFESKLTTPDHGHSEDYDKNARHGLYLTLRVAAISRM
jgi:hypothetical protein